jgi:hypothetical protein
MPGTFLDDTGRARDIKNSSSANDCRKLQFLQIHNCDCAALLVEGAV